VSKVVSFLTLFRSLGSFLLYLLVGLIRLVDGVISQFILFLILKLGLFVLNNLLNYLFLEGKRFVNRLLASFFHSSRSIALLLAHRIDLLVNERVLSICGAFLEILLRLSSFLVII